MREMRKGGLGIGAGAKRLSDHTHICCLFCSSSSPYSLLCVADSRVAATAMRDHRMMTLYGARQ